MAASDGFKPCDACNGAGSVPTAAKCCAAHAHGAEDHGHHGHHGQHGSPTTLRAVMEALDLVDEEGTPVKASDAFEGKVVGLYFSARHCPGCERFSPVLAALTRRHEAELCTVLVSGDGDEETAAAAARGKGFLRVPFHSPHRGILMRAFGIFAIPVLVRRQRSFVLYTPSYTQPLFVSCSTRRVCSLFPTREAWRVLHPPHSPPPLFSNAPTRVRRGGCRVASVQLAAAPTTSARPPCQSGSPPAGLTSRVD